MIKSVIGIRTELSWIEHEIIDSINNLHTKGILWEQDNETKEVIFHLDITEYDTPISHEPSYSWIDARDLRGSLDKVESFCFNMSDHIKRKIQEFKRGVTPEYSYRVFLKYGKKDNEQYEYQIKPSMEDIDLIVFKVIR